MLDVEYVNRYVHMMQSSVESIVITGVGGQGILTASQIIALAALKAGFDVKKTEEKGLSQRGGSVVSFVRFGKKVYSPVPIEGTCKLLLSLEESETLRWLHYMDRENGTAVVNEFRHIPLPVTLGIDEYPEEPVRILKKYLRRVITVPAIKIAEELGSKVVANTVLLGTASVFLPISMEAWVETIKQFFAEKYIGLNIEAFNRGYKLVATTLGTSK